jgi:hypothetical protein
MVARIPEAYHLRWFVEGDAGNASVERLARDHGQRTADPLRLSRPASRLVPWHAVRVDEHLPPVMSGIGELRGVELSGIEAAVGERSLNSR